MTPKELSLFSDKEQTVLVATEPDRLKAMSEDELDDLLMLVRRARNKYSKLHRRQSSASIDASGKRYAATTSNERTLRKAEIFEDALARVTRALSAAARASRDELKRERLAVARGTAATPGEPTPAGGRPSGASSTTRTGSGSGGRGHVTPKRAASTRARNARSQARRDQRR